MSLNQPQFLALAQSIWMHPKAVIRQVVDYDARFGQREIILTLSGLSGLLVLSQGPVVMLLEIALNFIMLIVSTYSMAWLLWLTGKPMQGKASFSALCAAMIWPMIPAIWGTLLAIPLLGTEGWGDILQGLFYLYSFHLMVQTVAEVQEFSALQSFFNQLVALIISLVPFLFFWKQIMIILRPLLGM